MNVLRAHPHAWRSMGLMWEYERHQSMPVQSHGHGTRQGGAARGSNFLQLV
jgi:hypothetical protein